MNDWFVCDKCGEEKLESDRQDSHDVPCYLFSGYTRQQRKQKADPWGRHALCKRCHGIYEGAVLSHIVDCLDEKTKQMMREAAKRFARTHFKEANGNSTPITN